MKFQPMELQVEKGDTVLWVNKDITTHDVTEEKTKAWHSPPLVMGQSWEMIVKQPSDYFCSIHLVMKGRLGLK